MHRFILWRRVELTASRLINCSEILFNWHLIVAIIYRSKLE